MLSASIWKTSKSLTSKIAIACLAVLFVVIFGSGLVNFDVSQAKGGRGDGAKFCSRTAQAAYKAGMNEVKDDYWIAVGKCNNLSEAEARAECLEDAKAEAKEGKELTKDQREARLEICEDLGEAPYDPEINPDDFVDFEAVVDGGDFTPNPYFPLVPGTVRDYEVTDDDGEVIEKIKVEILAETKEILGVNCIVVHDRVWEIDEDGEESLIEDTLDWYAQDLAGNVWYMGEIALNFEEGELVDVEGSWKAGRDSAKPGVLMWLYPAGPDPEPIQEVYRQEFLLGDAEDIGEFVGFVDSITIRGVTYHNVLKTKDYTPIEPDVFEYKYYAPGVGVILEEAFEDGEFTGERVELVP